MSTSFFSSDFYVIVNKCIPSLVKQKDTSSGSITIGYLVISGQSLMLFLKNKDAFELYAVLLSIGILTYFPFPAYKYLLNKFTCLRMYLKIFSL